MNQRQAQILMKLNREDAVEILKIAKIPQENYEHIMRFSELGLYQGKYYGNQWITKTDLAFNCGFEYYRPVPERKICWEKAMKNGAWGEEFLFSDYADFHVRGKYILYGYDEHRKEFRFSGGIRAWKYCKPLPDFEIPESWLEG